MIKYEFIYNVSINTKNSGNMNVPSTEDMTKITGWNVLKYQNLPAIIKNRFENLLQLKKKAAQIIVPLLTFITKQFSKITFLTYYVAVVVHAP